MDNHSSFLSLFFPLIKFKKEAVFSLSQSGEGSKGRRRQKTERVSGRRVRGGAVRKSNVYEKRVNNREERGGESCQN